MVRCSTPSQMREEGSAEEIETEEIEADSDEADRVN